MLDAGCWMLDAEDLSRHQGNSSKAANCSAGVFDNQFARSSGFSWRFDTADLSFQS
jgi:hypothetical protein